MICLRPCHQPVVVWGTGCLWQVGDARQMGAVRHGVNQMERNRTLKVHIFSIILIGWSFKENIVLYSLQEFFTHPLCPTVWPTSVAESRQIFPLASSAFPPDAPRQLPLELVSFLPSHACSLFCMLHVGHHRHGIEVLTLYCILFFLLQLLMFLVSGWD